MAKLGWGQMRCDSRQEMSMAHTTEIWFWLSLNHLIRKANTLNIAQTQCQNNKTKVHRMG
jgi:hypothetical protein